MSSLIEKITLYDLLGYSIPGSILIGMAGSAYLIKNNRYQCFYDTYKDSFGYLFSALLVLGYVAGMLIAEITDIIIGACKATLDFDVKEKLKEVDYKSVEKALKKANYMTYENRLRSEEDVLKYLSSMYGDIQSDVKYNRLHNYSSSKLVCKNLAFVSFCGFIIVLSYLIQSFDLMFLPDTNVVKVVFIICGCCTSFFLFIRRWKKMYVKTQFYTVVWFIEKYNKDENG